MNELEILRNFYEKMKKLSTSGAWPEDKECSLADYIEDTAQQLNSINESQQDSGYRRKEHDHGFGIHEW